MLKWLWCWSYWFLRYFLYVWSSTDFNKYNAIRVKNKFTLNLAVKVSCLLGFSIRFKIYVTSRLWFQPRGGRVLYGWGVRRLGIWTWFGGLGCYRVWLSILVLFGWTNVYRYVERYVVRFLRKWWVAYWWREWLNCDIFINIMFLHLLFFIFKIGFLIIY